MGGGIKPLSRYNAVPISISPREISNSTAETMVSTRAAQASPRTSSIASITLSPEELSTKTLAPRHLQAALEALHRDGIPLLSNAIPTSDLDILNSRMVPEAKHLYALSTTHRTTYDSERSVDYKGFEAMVCGNAESDGGTESHARFHTFLWLV